VAWSYKAPNGILIDERRIVKPSDGSGHELIDVQSRRFTRERGGGTTKNWRMADDPDIIRTRRLLTTSLDLYHRSTTIDVNYMEIDALKPGVNHIPPSHGVAAQRGRWPLHS